MMSVAVESLFFLAPLSIIEGIGAMEMLLVAVIGLLLFGGKGLPDMARTFGKIMREFKKASSTVEAEVKRVMNEEPDDRPTPPRPRRTAPSALPPAKDAAEPTPPPAAAPEAPDRTSGPTAT